jgi:Mg2+ and Co2+ transporter CorA
VEEELDRFENQMQYSRSSNEDVARRIARLVELLFNMSARISSQSTMQMTRYAMQESASVGTISIVTMVFLPGTFIAGILGTNIITGPSRSNHAVLEPNDLQLLVSSQWWVLLVATVALTLATFAVWWFLRQRGRRMIDRKIRRIGQGEAV